jgi:hypothetical protein
VPPPLPRPIRPIKQQRILRRHRDAGDRRTGFGDGVLGARKVVVARAQQRVLRHHGGVEQHRPVLMGRVRPEYLADAGHCHYADSGRHSASLREPGSCMTHARGMTASAQPYRRDQATLFQSRFAVIPL